MYAFQAIGPGTVLRGRPLQAQDGESATVYEQVEIIEPVGTDNPHDMGILEWFGVATDVLGSGRHIVVVTATQDGRFEIQRVKRRAS